MKREQWRQVVDWFGWYEVSNLGRVRSVARKITRRNGDSTVLGGRILSPHTNKDGYLLVHLHKPGLKKSRRVHQLVIRAFVGEYPAGCEVNHIDGNKKNNALSNLEYITHSENMLHAMRIGIWLNDHSRGELNPKAKLRIGEAVEIRKSKIPTKILAEKYGVNRTTIQGIRSGKYWNSAACRAALEAKEKGGPSK